MNMVEHLDLLLLKIFWRNCWSIQDEFWIADEQAEIQKVSETKTILEESTC